MKKKIILLVLAAFLAAISLAPLGLSFIKNKRQSDLLLYLENRYDSSFEIVDTIPNEMIGENVYFAYRIKDVNGIEFIAGKEREKMLLPLLPGCIQSTFFDDYDEKINFIEEEKGDRNDS